MRKLRDIERIHFRSDFRIARATALRDAEGYQDILFTTERFGIFLSKNVSNLWEYRSSFLELCDESRNVDCVEFYRLYILVKDARNDALHQGAYARHLTINAIKLALLFEDILMPGSDEARCFMVENPICAQMWQPISYIRQQMLVNSFTYLPVQLEQGWHFISDISLSTYLCAKDRNKRLAYTLQEAIRDNSSLLSALTLAKVCSPNTTKEQILAMSEGRPVLVIKDEHLMGIVTPFDLL